VPANRKKGFYTNRLSKNEEIGGIFVFTLAAQNFKLFKNSRSKFSNKIPKAVDVLF
jgi:hypothetical protein